MIDSQTLDNVVTEQVRQSRTELSVLQERVSIKVDLPNLRRSTVIDQGKASTGEISSPGLRSKRRFDVDGVAPTSGTVRDLRVRTDRKSHLELLTWR